MDKFSLLYLTGKYPLLAGFISSCYTAQEFDKLWDFLHALELDENYLHWN